jgi:hypothetical protein
MDEPIGMIVSHETGGVLIQIFSIQFTGRGDPGEKPFFRCADQFFQLFVREGRVALEADFFDPYFFWPSSMVNSISAWLLSLV